MERSQFIVYRDIDDPLIFNCKQFFETAEETFREKQKINVTFEESMTNSIDKCLHISNKERKPSLYTFINRV